VARIFDNVHPMRAGRRRIVVLGASFAGLAAALELHERVGRDHDVVVVSPDEEFLFLPSLIWVPFGLRERSELVFPIAPLLESRGIRFVAEAVRTIDLDARIVRAERAHEPYDFLLVATGARQDFDAVDGLGPRGDVQSIFTWEGASRARAAFEAMLSAPGPIVAGCVQGAQTFLPAYETALNAAHQLRRRGLADRCPITFVTPEPYVGHLGSGELGAGAASVARMLEQANVRAIADVAVERIVDREIVLSDGQRLPFAFAMLTPPFLGVEAVRACKELVDARGFVKVDAHLRTARAEVLAAGLCVAAPPVEGARVACGRPINGALSEQMGRVAARNVVAAIEGTALESIDLHRTTFTMDAGDRGASLETGDDGRDGANLPSPGGHWAKAAFERYFLTTRSRGLR